MEKWQNSTHHSSETPQPIDTKFETSDDVCESIPCAKFCADPSIGGFLANGLTIMKFFSSIIYYSICVAVFAVIGGDVEIIHQFRMQIATIQHAAVSWLHSVVPKLLVIKPSDFVHWYCNCHHLFAISCRWFFKLWSGFCH